MNWVINNISWLKDVLWVLFTLIATLLAILTYRRARYTLLQPLRSEVVKRQTEVLVELLDFVSVEKGEFYFDLDYMGIAACNAFDLLTTYNFKLTDDKISKAVQENIGGFMLLEDSGPTKTFKVHRSPFHEQLFDDEKEFENYKKELNDQIEKGVVRMEKLYLTKTHQKTIQKINEFIANPFMPTKIINLLETLLADIDFNLKNYMIPELKKFILQAKSFNSSEENPLHISYQAIYNSFIYESKSHSPTIKDIRKEIREYLLIDKKWF
ncbi:hypothetical protein [Caproicibacter sp. BJN0012]|uniref:hypothetical protein n=1 Tax=Caproicibacter sp. BJN0012 TaxID=3110227 RepID=UPI002E163977